MTTTGFQHNKPEIFQTFHSSKLQAKNQSHHAMNQALIKNLLSSGVRSSFQLVDPVGERIFFNQFLEVFSVVGFVL